MRIGFFREPRTHQIFLSRDDLVRFFLGEVDLLKEEGQDYASRYVDAVTKTIAKFGEEE